MAYNINGLKYFIYNTTINKNDFLELPLDIRKIIWEYAHCCPYIQCYICDKILIHFEINLLDNNESENFSIINGLIKCNTCNTCNT